MLPLRVREAPEGCRDRADVALDVVVRREIGIGAEVSPDALERRRLDDGPDVVDDEPRDRTFRLCRGDDAEEAAHRGADPVDRFGAAPRDQRDERGQIGRKDVVVRVGEPVALAAARHVDREDAMGCRERFAQNVEIAAIPSNAMHADDDARIAGVSPFVVDNAMESVRRQAVELVPARFGAVSGMRSGCGAFAAAKPGSSAIGALRQSRAGLAQFARKERHVARRRAVQESGELVAPRHRVVVAQLDQRPREFAVEQQVREQVGARPLRAAVSAQQIVHAARQAIGVTQRERAEVARGKQDEDVDVRRREIGLRDLAPGEQRAAGD